MKKRRLLIFSIINLIATFLPYGLINMETNYFLWKDNRCFAPKSPLILGILNGINIINAITIYVSAVSLLIVAIVCLNKNIIKEKIVKTLTVISVCANLFFCYHICEFLQYKYVNIGVLLAIVACIGIIISLSEFDKKNLLILGASLVLSLPTFVVRYRIDIEGPIEIIYYSVQTYFCSIYNNLIYGDISWITAIPSLMVIYYVIKSVACVLTNCVKKNRVVKILLGWMIIAFGLDVFIGILDNYKMNIFPTYPIAILLLGTYLHSEKKSNKVKQSEN